jgi:hypothetical protein
MLGRSSLATLPPSAIDSPRETVTLGLLDRTAVAYLTLPLVLFLVGWLEPWAALPLVACVAYCLKPLFAALPGRATRLPITPMQLAGAAVVGIAWTVLGGTAHLFFANSDWHIRDAVLHDLVASPWPVGYGGLDGKESLLRAPIAYFLPAALVGKVAGLAAAHLAMAVWTAVGATVFLLQVLSLTPSRVGVAATVVVVVVLFSGLDILGSMLDGGLHFRGSGNIASHLEWWAPRFQYSSMTTQLFWVPNHALGAWLTVGLLCRNDHNRQIDLLLPIIVVALALWSPLAALGVVPFVLWKTLANADRAQFLNLLHPRVWAPALAVGIVIVGYLALDLSGVSKGWSQDDGESIGMHLLRHAQFFLLEAGFIGLAVLAIRRSGQVALALLILAVLPFAHIGPGNDLVMRASIPSLAVLAIGACLALLDQPVHVGRWWKKAALGGLLAVGAVTPVHEFARAVALPAWPVNLAATLVGAACGTYPAHYVARVGTEAVSRVLRHPHALALGPQGADVCANPALGLMWKADLL